MSSWLWLPLPEWYGSPHVNNTCQAVEMLVSASALNMTLNTCIRLIFSHSLFHKHSPSPTLNLKTLLISSWSLEFFFLELLPKFDLVRFQIWAYFLLHFERTTKDNLNHYLLNLFVFRKEVSSVQWGKSTANNRSHGKIVLAIFSSILRTP